MKALHARMNVYTLLIAVCVLAFGMAIGYYLGYDHGWEEAVGYLHSGSK